MTDTNRLLIDKILENYYPGTPDLFDEKISTHEIINSISETSDEPITPKEVNDYLSSKNFELYYSTVDRCFYWHVLSNR